MPDTATGSPWWRQELVRFSARARQMLRKNFSSLDRLHDDLISETLVQLTMLLSRQPGASTASTSPASPDTPGQPGSPDSTDPPDSPDLRSAWFAPEAPSEEDARRFRGLCMTVLNRRVVDHFRTDYKQWALEHPLGDDINEDDGIALQHSTDREEVSFPAGSQRPGVSMCLMNEVSWASAGRYRLLLPAPR